MNRSVLALLTALSLLIASTFAACGGDSGTSPDVLDERPPEVEPRSPDPAGEVTVSFADDVLPLFDRGGCTDSGCHGRPYQADLQLRADSAWVMLVDVVGLMEPNVVRVIPGDPDASYLIRKLEGRHTIGFQMPSRREPRPQEEIDVMRTWIAEGARNN